MDTYRTIKFSPDQYKELTGREKHEVDVPFAEHLDLWVDWKADRDVIVWLYFQDGMRMPYANGLRGQFSVRTHGVISVVIACTKSTHVALCVQYKDLAVKEKKDWTPVEIAPPPPAELKLQDAVRRELARLGVYSKDDELLEVSEEDNLEEEIDDEGFGAGYMEEETPKPVRLRTRKPAESPGRGGAAPGGDDQRELFSGPGGPVVSSDEAS